MSHDTTTSPHDGTTSEPGAYEYPASYAQERMWFLDQFHPNNAAYNIPAVFQLPEPLDVPVLTRSLNEIVHRHEVLRTTFKSRGGQLYQVTAPRLEVLVPVTDLPALAEVGDQAEAQRLMAQEAATPFDLANGPLIRCRVARLGPSRHLTLITQHHIISDGWSMGVFETELRVLYEAYCAGRPSPLPELPIQYVDYVAWLRGLVQGGQLQLQLDYWLDRLKGAPPVIELVGDRPRPAVPSLRGAAQTFTFPGDLNSKLKKFARDEGGTLFMVLLAGFYTLLHRYSGQTDLVVAIPIANRTRAELEGLIGCFLNNLVLRVDLSGEPSFREVVRRVRDLTLDAYANQDIPFEVIVEHLRPERNISYNPVFQVMFVLQNLPTLPQFGAAPAVGEEGGVSVEWRAVKFDLSLSMVETVGGVSGALEYTHDLFDDATITRMVGHLRTLTAAALASPDSPVSRLQLMTPAERQRVLCEWNETDADYPDDVCIHQLFAQQAAATPAATAAVFDSDELTYGELNRRANRLAHYLRSAGVGPGHRVALCLDRSLDMVVGLLGVLKAGAAYVPLEPSLPRERFLYMLSDTRPSALLSQEGVATRLPAHDVPVCLLDAPGAFAGQPEHDPDNRTRPADTAYVIYTSGSTGRPKGVVVDHRAVVDRLYWMIDGYAVTAADRYVQKHPYSFDVSVWEFFLPLITGGCVVMIRPDGHRDLGYLVRVMTRQRVTFACFLPSVLQLFLEEAGVAECGRTLRVMLCGAETMARVVPSRFYQVIPGAELYNLYGPTETCIHVTSYHCPRASLPHTVPIGKPMGRVKLYILDRHRQPVPVGVPGEVYLGGTGVARGYLNRPAETSAAFLPDPFAGLPTARMYKTGDVARFLPDGNVEFIGRLDHQLKIRGNRVELGEIKQVLMSHPAVIDAVVTAREDRPGDKRLVGYVVAAAGPRLSPAELTAFLAASLPDYMIPSAFLFLERIPLGPNDKVDFQALPPPSASDLRRDESYVAPRTPTEEGVAGLFRELLQVDQVGAKDNFFHLGGHSLLATQLVSRVRAAFQVDLALRKVFECPTVEELAGLIAQAPKSVRPEIAAIPRALRSPASE